MGRVYPLPLEKPFEQHSFHEMGVLLDHFLHAQDTFDKHPPFILEYFGDYLSASSFYRKDRAKGWKGENENRDLPYPKDIEMADRLIPAIGNVIHGPLRSLALDFRMRLEKPEGYEEIGKQLAEILKEYRKFISDNNFQDPDTLLEKLTPEQRERFSCADTIAKLRDILSTERMPTITFHWGNGDIKTDTFQNSITIDNVTPLHPELNQSIPALAIFVAGYTGMAMVDRTKIPSAYRDFLKNVTDNEADITFILDALAARIIETNDRQSRVKESTSRFDISSAGIYESEREANIQLIRQHFSDKFNMPRILEVIKDHPTDLAINYHFHKITDEITEESLQTIKRFVRFAKQDYTENFAVPVEITQPEQAGVLLYAVSATNPLSQPIRNALQECARKITKGEVLEKSQLELVKHTLKSRAIAPDHAIYTKELQRHFGFDLEKTHRR